MSLLHKIVARAKAIDARWFTSHRLACLPEIAALLGGKKLNVADVGAADGPEARWNAARAIARFITFEPNPRPGLVVGAHGDVSFPIGLWSAKCRKTLHLTKHPDSSSVCNLNFRLLSDFQAQAGVELTSKTEIELDTLDNTLAGHPELAPDFLKVDVEGGDLEVLKGATLALERSVLGVRTEAPLVEIHHGAPQLWDLYAHLRPTGFVLFHFSRVQWVRNNGLVGYSSQPQYIWGDAVFFLSRPAFFRRLENVAPAERTALLTRFLTILLCHGVHDYALELLEAAGAARLVPATDTEKLRHIVEKSADTSGFYFFKLTLGLLVSLAGWVVSLPFAGPRQHAVYYVKQRGGRLAYDLWRLASRGGRPATAAIEEAFL